MKLTGLFLLTLSFYAHSFTLNNNVSASFSQDEVSIYITSNSSCSNTGVSRDEMLNLAVEAANQYWNTVPTSRLRLRRGGVLNTTDNDFITGELCEATANCGAGTIPQVSSIVITCNTDSTNNFPSSGFSGVRTLAIAAPVSISGTSIVGSVIAINDTGTSSFGQLSRSEMIAVLAHELGHAVGLGHSRYNNNLMFYETVARRESLGQDDIDGITYLYPVIFDGCGLFGTTESFVPPVSGMRILSWLALFLSLFAIMQWRKARQLSKASIP